MITTAQQLEVAKKQAKLLQEALDKHVATEPETAVNVAAYAQALELLNEIQAEICLYSVRESLK